MANYKSLALAFLLSSISSNAFLQPCPAALSLQKRTSSTPSSTELFVIGPMIRKMREEQAKKKMPMASDVERSSEAPGLRVGTGAWKWPPVWPYEGDAFTPLEEIKKPKPAAASAMGGLLTGGMSSLPTAAVEDEEELEKLDVMKYWGEEKAEVTTDIDAEAIDALKNHYGYYLRDGMAVLEFGAAENSYLPDGLKLSRHVGVGANKKLMDQNSDLTESLVINLNDVIEEQGVNSDELRSMSSTFDVILMANTIDFLNSPREVFRTAWGLLKPGGLMIVPFTNREAYDSKFQRAQTKMWREMTDDQHMWICGSFFQFSAGDGWEGLKGFDISPESAKKEEGIMSFLNQNKNMNMYVVQATKSYQDDSIDSSNPEKSFKSKMWILPTMEDRDKQLLAPRLARAYNALHNDDEKEALGQHVEILPKVYESLIKMDTFAFTFSMQAQLAADLIVDKDFNGSDEQITALKMGLGLRKPSADFWEPVGRLTSGMNPDDKVNLLAHLVPRFGSGDADQEEALQAFVSGLEPTFNVIRSKGTELSEADIQLVGSELLAAEILKPGRSTKAEFASWVGSLTESELREYLTKRKSFKENSVAEMKEFQAARQAEIERIEEARKKMQEQQEKARQERTMAFNPETGKMEEIKKK